jgi:hypothetical protein
MQGNRTAFGKPTYGTRHALASTAGGRHDVAHSDAVGFRRDEAQDGQHQRARPARRQRTHAASTESVRAPSRIPVSGADLADLVAFSARICRTIALAIAVARARCTGVSSVRSAAGMFRIQFAERTTAFDLADTRLSDDVG